MGKPVNKTLRIAAMSAGEEIGHVSGPIATFRGNGDPLRSLLVGIDPVQEGTGDPSPDNVRPISGWSAVNVWRTGKNLFSSAWEQGSINGNTGNNTLSDTIVRTVGFISVKPGQTYSFTRDKTSGLMNFRGYDQNYGYIGYGESIYVLDSGGTTINPMNSGRSSCTITIGPGVYYLRINDYTNDISIKYTMREGSTPLADYTPYSGDTYTIQLGQTVYGAQLDVTNGVLTVTMANIASYNGETLPGEWMSDRDVYAPGTAPTIGAQVVYTLATPITIPITPTQISALRGENNVWADCGDVDVEYVATGGDGGKLALLLRNRKELLIALRKGLTPAEAGLLSSTPLLGGIVRPGLSTDDEKEEDELW